MSGIKEVDAVDVDDADLLEKDVNEEINGAVGEISRLLGIGSPESQAEIGRVIRRRGAKISRRSYGYGKRRGRKQAVRSIEAKGKNAPLSAVVASYIDKLQDETARNRFKKGEIVPWTHDVYSTKLANTQSTIDFFEVADDQEAGITNSDKGQVGKGAPVLARYIDIAHGYAPSADKAGLKTATYTEELIPVVQNGELEMKFNDTLQVLRNTSVSQFKRVSDSQTGLVKYRIYLADPVWIEPQWAIKAQLKMPAAGVDDAANKKISAIRIWVGGIQLRA